MTRPEKKTPAVVSSEGQENQDSGVLVSTDSGSNYTTGEGSSVVAESPLEAALGWISRGFAVLPLNGKAPTLSNGHLGASTDEEQARRWWRGSTPLGVGVNPPADVVVVDIDPRSGGQQTWDRLAADQELPETLTVITGRGDGGQHLYFRLPEERPAHRPSAIGPGVDLKWSSGYLVADGSLHPETGQPYRLVSSSAVVADLPGWLAEHIWPAGTEEITREFSDAESSVTDSEEVNRVLDWLRATHSGERHDALLWAARTLRERGHSVDNRLRAAGLELGLPAAEVDGVLGWVRDNVESPAISFWDARPILRQLHDTARQQGVGPWGLLGVCLTRVLAATEPTLQGPDIVGGYSSANLGTCLVGASGQGKGGVEATADTFLSITGENGHKVFVQQANIGTGEGLARAFMGHQKNSGGKGDKDNPAPASPPPLERTRVLFSASEIDHLRALMQRDGQTLSSALRGLLMGETLGATNNSRESTTHLPAHSYRACITLSVQPERSGVLFEGESGGLPQRFAWFPVADPGTLDWEERQKIRKSRMLIRVRLPEEASSSKRVVYHVDESVQAEIGNFQARKQRGEAGIDPLDGHRMLTQLKVGLGLALLTGRAEVTEEDWALAGVVMGVSDRTRNQAKNALARVAFETSRVRGQTEAHREVAKKEALAEVEEKRQRSAGAWLTNRAELLRETGKAVKITGKGNDLYNARSEFRPLVKEVLLGDGDRWAYPEDFGLVVWREDDGPCWMKAT